MANHFNIWLLKSSADLWHALNMLIQVANNTYGFCYVLMAKIMLTDLKCYEVILFIVYDRLISRTSYNYFTHLHIHIELL